MLEGKKILVTGASRGIGRAIALACARERAVVGINFRDSGERAQGVQREIRDRHGMPSHVLCFDVSDEAAVAGAVARFRAAEGRIDGLVNNAAINLPGLLVSADVERLRRQIDVNLLGPLLCARAVLPAMIEQRAGTILNIGSVAGVRPSRGQTAYAATKGALESFTHALAVEYGRKGIRAACLRVGPVATEMIEGAQRIAGEEILDRMPLRRIGRPEEIADLAAFLLSDRASFITGSIVTIDGGYSRG